MKSALSYLPVGAGLVVLVLSLAVAVLTVTSKSTNQQSAAKAAVETTGSLSLAPATGQYTFVSGATYPVGIIVDSAGKTIDGVDVIINFDPKKVKVVGSQVALGTLFENIPVNKVDNTIGQIKLSALTFNAKPLTGIVGTFRIQPLLKGEVDINFYFIPGATTDSNIAEHGTALDILGKVDNAKFIFK